MLSSVMSRLNDRRNAAAELGEDAGFTLIELMVVLLILAILLAIAIPTFLGVTAGANDKAAQANDNTALTSLKSAATLNNQTYGTPAASALSVTQMKSNEPSLSWVQATLTTAAAVTAQGPVDYYVSADGNGVVVVSYTAATKTCWYAADNLSSVVDASATGAYGATAAPSGAATKVPTGPGTWYAKASTNSGSGATAGCDPSLPVVGADPNYSPAGQWANSFSNAK